MAFWVSMILGLPPCAPRVDFKGLISKKKCLKKITTQRSPLDPKEMGPQEATTQKFNPLKTNPLKYSEFFTAKRILEKLGTQTSPSFVKIL